MQRRGYARPNHVYLDTTALAEVPDTTIQVVDARRPRLCGVASFNGGWRADCRNAIQQAHTMLFVGTAEWCASAWCRGEYDYFESENRQRRNSGRLPLKGIALVFPDCTDAFGGLDIVRADRELVDPTHPDFWHIPGVTLLQLLGKIGRP